MVNRAGLLPRAHACEGAGEKLHCQRAGLLQWSRCCSHSLRCLTASSLLITARKHKHITMYMNMYQLI